MSPPPNTILIATFCEYMTQRSFSPFTIKRRTSSLSSFARYIAPMHLAQVEGDHVMSWVGTLRSARTKHAYRSDLGAFYSWATKRKVVRRNPVDDTDAIRVPKGLPRPAPIEAIPSIIAMATDDHLRLALAFAAYAGLRRSEIAHITTDDVQFGDHPMIAVRNGKGSKDRFVPMHPELVRMLSTRRPSGLLVPISVDQLGRRSSDHMRALGYDCTLHQLRHAFGTELARVTRGNVIAVGRAMGHESANTTLNYVGWDGGNWSALFGRMFKAA